MPALRRSYAEWYDWARREIGGDSERLHEATHAAIESLQRGGGSAEAAAAARAAVPLAAPPAPPPVGYGDSSTQEPASAPVGTSPTGPLPSGGTYEPAAFEGSLPYAGFWRRLAAFAIDLVFVLLGSLLVSLLIAVLLAIALVSTSGSAPTDAIIVQLASLEH